MLWTRFVSCPWPMRRNWAKETPLSSIFASKSTKTKSLFPSAIKGLGWPSKKSRTTWVRLLNLVRQPSSSKCKRVATCLSSVSLASVSTLCTWSLTLWKCAPSRTATIRNGSGNLKPTVTLPFLKIPKVKRSAEARRSRFISKRKRKSIWTRANWRTWSKSTLNLSTFRFTCGNLRKNPKKFRSKTTMKKSPTRRRTKRTTMRTTMRTTTMRTTTTTMRTRKTTNQKRKRLRKPSGTGSYSTTLKLSGSDRLPKLNRKSTPSFTRRCRKTRAIRWRTPTSKPKAMLSLKLFSSFRKVPLRICTITTTVKPPR